MWLLIAAGKKTAGTQPARDLGPRIAHALLPIKGKGSSDWSYAWVPVVGPLIGGALGGFMTLWLPDLLALVLEIPLYESNAPL